MAYKSLAVSFLWSSLDSERVPSMLDVHAAPHRLVFRVGPSSTKKHYLTMRDRSPAALLLRRKRSSSAVVACPRRAQIQTTWQKLSAIM